MIKRPNLKKTKNGKYRMPKWPNLRAILNKTNNKHNTEKAE
jgi:hypothetical protein